MIPIHNDNPSYEEWCETLGRDPEDDKNYMSYCEWMQD